MTGVKSSAAIVTNDSEQLYDHSYSIHQHSRPDFMASNDIKTRALDSIKVTKKRFSVHSQEASKVDLQQQSQSVQKVSVHQPTDPFERINYSESSPVHINR